MKKLISVILSVVMVLGSFSAFAAAETQPMSVEYYFTEDFETSAVGSAPEKGTCNVAGTNKLTVCTDGAAGSKALKYDITSTNSTHYQHSVSPKGNKVIMEFDIKYDDVGYGNGIMRLCFKDSVNNEILIANITANRQLCTASGDVVANVSPGKFYSVCIAISIDTYLADIYINQRKRASKVALSAPEFNSISTIRYQLFQVKAGELPCFYLDNVKAYGADEPVFRFEKRTGLKADDGSGAIAVSSIASIEDVEKYMDGTLALYVGKNKMAIDGEAQYLDPSSRDVSVFVQNSRAYVPIRFVSEALDYDVNWDADSSVVTIKNNDTSVQLTANDSAIVINGKDNRMDTVPVIKDGRMFIPVRAVCEAFGKKLTYDKSGLIVIADRENFFNFRNDLGIFRTLSGLLVFDQPSGSEMIDMLKTNFPANQHPRLYLDSVKLKKIKYDISTNEYMKEWADDVIASAENYCKRDVLKYELRDGSRLLGVSRDAKSYIETLSFAYLITGNTKYSDRAIAELINVCSYEDWHPRHFLDAAEMMQAVAVGYDWLYDVLTAEQKSKIKTALINYGLNEIMMDFTNDPVRDRGNKWTLLLNPDNWNLVCNASGIIAALAIADEDETLASAVIDAGMKDIQDAILMYGPDGPWYEGPGYWQYATSYYVNLMACLRSIYGTAFGYLDAPGVAQTGYYINSLLTSAGLFNFHDSTATSVNAPEQFFFADSLSDSSLAQIRINQMTENKTNGQVRDLLYYNTGFENVDLNLDLDYYWRDTEVVSMRNNWTSNSSIFVGFHAGAVDVYHGHMDMGEVVIDAYGTQYAKELGAESYNLGVNEWELYRNRAEGHNTLVINPSKDGGQEVSGASVIERFESNNGCAYAVTDMTSGYVKSADSVKRGVKFTNNRSNIIIQDEIKAREPSEVYWFLHSECDIQVSSDGKSACIAGDFKDLYVYLLDDVDGTFSVMEAQPLPTSPVVTSQNKNLSYKKLAFHAENVTDMTLAIGMEFVFPGQDTSDVYMPDVVPLESWTLDDVKTEKKPELSDISINGVTVDGFAPENLNYTYRMKYDDPTPVVTAAGDGEVSVQMPDVLPGYIFIKIASNEDANVSETYVIKVIQEVLSEAPPGLKTMSISSVEASSVPQPQNSAENSFDGDLDTRWSANGNADIVYDLGEEQTVSHLGIAVYQGGNDDGRKQYFEILVSTDGINYTRVYTGESSGTTIDKEIFPITPSKCRYVKIDCNGTSVGTWNSLTEVAIYGPQQ